MLKIRLTRTGKRNISQFRIVVAESARPVKGKFIEVLGSYNPHSKEKLLKRERIKYWISKGAKPSVTAHNMLVASGIIKGEKIKIKTKPRKKDEKPASTAGKEEKKAEVSKSEESKEKKKKVKPEEKK